MILLSQFQRNRVIFPTRTGTIRHDSHTTEHTIPSVLTVFHVIGQTTGSTVDTAIFWRHSPKLTAKVPIFMMNVQR